MIQMLKPLIDRQSYSEAIADDIVQQLYDAIYKPLFDILQIKTPGRVNSIEDLRKAFRSGKLYYLEGYLFGQFNAVIGRALRNLGAAFDKKRKAYKVDLSRMPVDIRTDMAIGSAINKNKTERILAALEKARQMKIILGSGARAVATIDDLNKISATHFKVLPENIQIPYELTAKQKEELVKSYSEGLHAYTNEWKDEAIDRLYAKTQANATLGYRADRLANIVKSEFGISRKKAQFIARQETSLFVSKYREQRYVSAGIRQYVWSTSHDERVRPDHLALDHQIFSWDNPPIVDRATGRRGNPGEDFQCRCVALPVLRLGVQ